MLIQGLKIAVIENSQFAGNDGKPMQYTKAFVTFPGDEFPLSIGFVGFIPKGARGTISVNVTASKDKLVAKILADTFTPDPAPNAPKDGKF